MAFVKDEGDGFRHSSFIKVHSLDSLLSLVVKKTRIRATLFVVVRDVVVYVVAESIVVSCKTRRRK